jgi:hypothetical protein
MANTVANVTTGKPKKIGAIFRAPKGTTLPTTANAELDDAFKCLGYASEDGMTNSNSPDTDTVRAWGGDTVMNLENSRDDTFQFTLIEAMNVDVLKAVYGDENVTGTLATGIAIKANSHEQEESCWVIDMIMRGGVLKRIVIPAGVVTEVGDVAYTDSDAVGYETTVFCLPDASGNTHYEYIMKQSA